MLSLKRRIGVRLRLGRESLRLRRAARGVHVTVEKEALCVGDGGLGLASGDVLYVEEGGASCASADTRVLIRVLIRGC